MTNIIHYCIEGNDKFKPFEFSEFLISVHKLKDQIAIKEKYTFDGSHLRIVDANSGEEYKDDRLLAHGTQVIVSRKASENSRSLPVDARKTDSKSQSTSLGCTEQAQMEHLQIKESDTEQHESKSSFRIFPFFSQKTTAKHRHEEINPLLLKASIGTSYISLFPLLNDVTEENRATAIQKMDLILGDLQMLIEETESMMPFLQVNTLVGEVLQQMKSGMNGYASQMCSDLGLESWRLRFVLSGGLSALLSLLMESPLFQNEIYLQPIPPSTLGTVVRVVSAFILDARATLTLGSQSSGSDSLESSDALPLLRLFNNTLEYSFLHVPIVVQTINATLSEDKTHYVPLPPVMLEPGKGQRVFLILRLMQLFVYFTNDIAVELPLLRLSFTTSPCIDSPLVQLHSYLTPTNISSFALTATIEVHPHSSHHCRMLDYFLYVPEELMDKYVSNTEEFEEIVQRHLDHISAVPVSSSASSNEQYPQRAIFSFLDAMQIINTYTPTKRLPGVEGSYSAASIEDKARHEILCTLFAILCATMQAYPEELAQYFVSSSFEPFLLVFLFALSHCEETIRPLSIEQLESTFLQIPCSSMLLEESAIVQLISSILDGSSALASFALGTATLLHIQQFAVFLGNMLARLMEKLQLCQTSLTMKTAMPSGGLSLQRLMTTFALLIRTHHKYHYILPPELYFPSFTSPNSEVRPSCLSYAQYLHLNRSNKISDGNTLPLLPLLAFMNTTFVFMEKKSQQADGVVAEELQKKEILLKEYFGYVSVGKKTGHRLIPFLWEKTLFYGLSNEDAQSSQTESHAPETLAIVNDFEIRNMIFEFISTLCHGSKVNQGCVFELLGKLQQLEDEHAYSGFNISALPLVSPWSRERSKYRGIHNPNAMSHIISIFTQLYIHPQFRSTFLMWDGQSEFLQNQKEQMVVSPPAVIVEQQLRRMRGMTPILYVELEDMLRKRIMSYPKEKKEECENIWNSVRLLFAELQDNPFNHSSIEMTSFLEAYFNKNQGEIIGDTQMDPNEFFMNLLRKLSLHLDFHNAPNFVRRLFLGKTQCITICEQGHSMEQASSFLTLQVNVKESSSIDEELRAMNRGSYASGLTCEACARAKKDNRKADVVQRITLKELPNTVFIQLKRFSYDEKTRVRTKTNSFFSFPIKDPLNFAPYMYESMVAADNGLTPEARYRIAKAAAEGRRIEDDLKKGTPLTLEQTQKLFRPKEYYLFELRGIVCHSGSAEGGHFYSFIKERVAPFQWYVFNDSSVFPVDIDTIIAHSFGGNLPFKTATTRSLDEISRGNEITNMRSAYLLIYERIKPVDDWQIERTLKEQYAPDMAFPFYPMHPQPPYPSPLFVFYKHLSSEQLEAEGVSLIDMPAIARLEEKRQSEKEREQQIFNDMFFTLVRKVMIETKYLTIKWKDSIEQMLAIIQRKELTLASVPLPLPLLSASTSNENECIAPTVLSVWIRYLLHTLSHSTRNEEFTLWCNELEPIFHSMPSLSLLLLRYLTAQMVSNENKLRRRCIARKKKANAKPYAEEIMKQQNDSSSRVPSSSFTSPFSFYYFKPEFKIHLSSIEYSQLAANFMDMPSIVSSLFFRCENAQMRLSFLRLLLEVVSAVTRTVDALMHQSPSDELSQKECREAASSLISELTVFFTALLNTITSKQQCAQLLLPLFLFLRDACKLSPVVSAILLSASYLQRCHDFLCCDQKPQYGWTLFVKNLHSTSPVDPKTIESTHLHAISGETATAILISLITCLQNAPSSLTPQGEFIYTAALSAPQTPLFAPDELLPPSPSSFTLASLRSMDFHPFASPLTQALVEKLLYATEAHHYVATLCSLSMARFLQITPQLLQPISSSLKEEEEDALFEATGLKWLLKEPGSFMGSSTKIQLYLDVVRMKVAMPSLSSSNESFSFPSSSLSSSASSSAASEMLLPICLYSLNKLIQSMSDCISKKTVSAARGALRMLCAVGDACLQDRFLSFSLCSDDKLVKTLVMILLRFRHVCFREGVARILRCCVAEKIVTFIQHPLISQPQFVTDAAGVHSDVRQVIITPFLVKQGNTEEQPLFMGEPIHPMLLSLQKEDPFTASASDESENVLVLGSAASLSMDRAAQSQFSFTLHELDLEPPPSWEREILNLPKDYIFETGAVVDKYSYYCVTSLKVDAPFPTHFYVTNVHEEEICTKLDNTIARVLLEHLILQVTNMNCEDYSKKEMEEMKLDCYCSILIWMIYCIHHSKAQSGGNELSTATLPFDDSFFSSLVKFMFRSIENKYSCTFVEKDVWKVLHLLLYLSFISYKYAMKVKDTILQVDKLLCPSKAKPTGNIYEVAINKGLSSLNCFLPYAKDACWDSSWRSSAFRSPPASGLIQFFLLLSILDNTFMNTFLEKINMPHWISLIVQNFKGSNKLTEALNFSLINFLVLRYPIYSYCVFNAFFNGSGKFTEENTELFIRFLCDCFFPIKHKLCLANPSTSKSMWDDWHGFVPLSLSIFKNDSEIPSEMRIGLKRDASLGIVFTSHIETCIKYFFVNPTSIQLPDSYLTILSKMNSSNSIKELQHTISSLFVKYCNSLSPDPPLPSANKLQYFDVAECFIHFYLKLLFYQRKDNLKSCVTIFQQLDSYLDSTLTYSQSSSSSSSSPPPPPSSSSSFPPPPPSSSSSFPPPPPSSSSSSSSSSSFSSSSSLFLQLPPLPPLPPLSSSPSSPSCPSFPAFHAFTSPSPSPSFPPLHLTSSFVRQIACRKPTNAPKLAVPVLPHLTNVIIDENHIIMPDDISQIDFIWLLVAHTSCYTKTALRIQSLRHLHCLLPFVFDADTVTVKLLYLFVIFGCLTNGLDLAFQYHDSLAGNIPEFSPPRLNYKRDSFCYSNIDQSLIVLATDNSSAEEKDFLRTELRWYLVDLVLQIAEKVERMIRANNTQFSRIKLFSLHYLEDSEISKINILDEPSFALVKRILISLETVLYFMTESDNANKVLKTEQQLPVISYLNLNPLLNKHTNFMISISSNVGDNAVEEKGYKEKEKEPWRRQLNEKEKGYSQTESCRRFAKSLDSIERAVVEKYQTIKKIYMLSLQKSKIDPSMLHRPPSRAFVPFVFNSITQNPVLLYHVFKLPFPSEPNWMKEVALSESNSTTLQLSSNIRDLVIYLFDSLQQASKEMNETCSSNSTVELEATRESDNSLCNCILSLGLFPQKHRAVNSIFAENLTTIKNGLEIIKTLKVTSAWYEDASIIVNSIVNSFVKRQNV